jgi:sirohydrochlorin ferrochelatase
MKRDIPAELAANGLTLVHVNNSGLYGPFGGHARSCTLVFQRKSNQTLMDVAVTFLNPKDRYNRRIGAERAIDLFQSGQYISLPCSKGTNPVDLLRYIFGGLPA